MEYCFLACGVWGEKSVHYRDVMSERHLLGKVNELVKMLCRMWFVNEINNL